jgi:hypothetical protein
LAAFLPGGHLPQHAPAPVAGKPVTIDEGLPGFLHMRALHLIAEVHNEVSRAPLRAMTAWSDRRRA